QRGARARHVLAGMPHQLRIRGHLGERRSPMLARAMLPLKVRMSTGSDTSGEKVSQALSFQYVSLRRGSRPIVENDSTDAMTTSPLRHAKRGRKLYGIVIGLN